jgi:hypothetical protein
MLRPGLLALLAALVQSPLPPGPLPEGNAYVRSLVGRQRAREEALNRYTYDVVETDEELRGDGRVKKRKTRRYEVFYVKGLPVRRQVGENGKALSPSDQAREDRRVTEKASAISRGLVAREQPNFRLSQILERYDFRATGREALPSGPAIVLEFQPLSGKRPLDSDNVLRALAGRVLVDEADQAVAKAEIRNISGIKFALGLGASVKTLDMDLAFLRMSDGVWLPSRVSATAAGRMFVFKSFRSRRTTTYSNWKRFAVETEEEARPAP